MTDRVALVEATFANISGAVGTSGKDLTVDDFYAAYTALQAEIYRPPVMVLHPHQALWMYWTGMVWRQPPGRQWRGPTGMKWAEFKAGFVAWVDNAPEHAEELAQGFIDERKAERLRRRKAIKRQTRRRKTGWR